MPGGAFLAGKRLGNPCRAQTHHGPARRGRTPGNENWFPPSNSQTPSWVPWRCSADRCSIDRLKAHFHGQGNLPSAKAIKEVRFRGTRPPVALRPISPGLTVPRAASSSVPVPRLHTQTATEQRFGWGRYKVKWGAWRAITTHVGRPDKQHPGCTSLLLQAPLPDPSCHPLPGGCLPEIASTTAPRPIWKARTRPTWGGSCRPTR